MHYFETGHWVPMILCQKHVSEENKLPSLSYTWPYIHVTCIIMVFLFSFKYLDNISLNIYTLLITITPLFYIINEIQWYTALNFFSKFTPVKGSHVFTCFNLLPCHKPLPISVWIMLYIIKYIFFECTYILLDNIRISWSKRIVIIVKI